MMPLNKPSPRLALLREQLAMEKFSQQNAREMYAHSAANPRTTHHYHPDYNADLADMWPAARDGMHLYSNRQEYDQALQALRTSGHGIAPAPKSYIDFTESQWSGCPKVGMIGVGDGDANYVVYGGGSYINGATKGTAAFESRQKYCAWLDGMSTTQPRASAWRLGRDIPASERVGQQPVAPWAVLGVNQSDKYDESRYTTPIVGKHAVIYPSSAYAGSAASAGQKLTHSVCIKEYMPHDFHVGDVLDGLPHVRFFPENWRACDPDGWIPHIPTPNRACPVPAGVMYQDVLADGEVGESGDNHCNWSTQPEPERRIVAWRPVAGGSAS
jgi:hypothetical protein